MRTCLGGVVIVWSCFVSACSTAPTNAAGVQTVPQLSDELVRALEQRVDLNSMRLCLHEFEETRSGNGSYYARSWFKNVPGIASELERAFLVALSRRVHLLEATLADADSPKLTQDPMQDVADHFRATHVLVGDFIRRSEDLVLVSIRVVEADTLLVVAAAQGMVRLESSWLHGENS